MESKGHNKFLICYKKLNNEQKNKSEDIEEKDIKLRAESSEIFNVEMINKSKIYLF